MLNPLKPKYWEMYHQFAYTAQMQSKAKREKVGAVIVTTTGLILPGYNGQPPGHHTECCENTPVTEWFGNTYGQRMKTDNSVIHAEDNAVRKALLANIDLTGAHLFSTVSPCPKCCQLVLPTGITAVHYDRHHDDKSGLIELADAGIEIHPR
jgi:dCMP deaminase